MGGGFGNGKTGTTVMKILDLAIAYPGSRGLFARSTKPKLEDTVKPEFFKWCPADWIAKYPTEKHNDVLLKNGSSIHFRHVRQEGKGKGENASNLLSATYDYAAVDQIDDPAFTHKDLLDLLGRLRGSTKYVGSDTTMPLQGPGWLLLTCNPTRNWVFRELVNPVHIFRKSGIVTEKLFWAKDRKVCLIDLFEATTYSNEHNTGRAYVESLESAYKGSMKERFLEGKWAAYEGLVYPDFDYSIHMMDKDRLATYIHSIIATGEFGLVEGYDHGIVVPSAYGLGITDKYNNTYLVDGFYETGLKISVMSDMIKEIRKKWNVLAPDPIQSDPALFRKSNASRELVGESVSEMFAEEGIMMSRGNNNIVSGIAKISSHLMVEKFHYNPIIGEFGGPHFMVSNELEWWANECSDYYWNKNIEGDNVDKPRDTNDHAMDMTKYMFTRRPTMGKLRDKKPKLPSSINHWHEMKDEVSNIKPRHMH